MKNNNDQEWVAGPREDFPPVPVAGKFGEDTNHGSEGKKPKRSIHQNSCDEKEIVIECRWPHLDSYPGG